MRWGLFDGRSSSLKGHQLLMGEPVDWSFKVVDPTTGQKTPDFAFGEMLGEIYEDTPKFNEWTPTARLVVKAPEMLELLERWLALYSPGSRTNEDLVLATQKMLDQIKGAK